MQGAVSGTLTVTISTSLDGVRFTPLPTQFTAVFATLSAPQRIQLSGIIDPWVQVSWSVSGGSPSFAETTLDLLFSPPDF